MPSSISNSEVTTRPGFVRLTASDRPGVAQPVPERDIPPQPWGSIIWVVLALTLMLLIAWEQSWRDYGARPNYLNSNESWAAQRRRLDTGEGDKTVLIGSSRTLFDIQLPVWHSVTGEHPIQLAMEGTSSLPMLQDLAADKKFTGRLLVGIVPDLFFTAQVRRADVISYFHKQSLSQRSGHWLSQHLLEPYFAFLDPDYALAAVVKRQAWPARAGLPVRTVVRKLRESEADRNTHMWRKVEVDPTYQALARSIWAERFHGFSPDLNTPEKRAKKAEEQIAAAAVAVQTLRARGVAVVFVRLPSSGPYYEFEQQYFPRAQTWDVLLQHTGAPGIHFEDYPVLQGYTQPEWSHLSAQDAKRFTAQLAPLVVAKFARQ
jgi:hypothetical protein